MRHFNKGSSDTYNGRQTAPLGAQAEQGQTGNADCFIKLFRLRNSYKNVLFTRHYSIPV